MTVSAAYPILPLSIRQSASIPEAAGLFYKIHSGIHLEGDVF